MELYLTPKPGLVDLADNGSHPDLSVPIMERSIGIVTALCPTIGYTAACHLAQEALKTGTPVRELVVSKGLLTGEQVEQALDPVRMTGR